MKIHMHGNMIILAETARMIVECLMCFVPRTNPGVKQLAVSDVVDKSFDNFLVHRLIASFEWEYASRG